jgi:phosphomannomutase
MCLPTKTISVSKLMQASGVSFGTSGVRGLVVDMSDEVCWIYTTAFLQTLTYLKAGAIVGLAGDLRYSSKRIMAVVAQAISDKGFTAMNYGHIPSPAIALYGLYSNCPTIMVTGSHIPDDRNGIKFNTATGEILKIDETKITEQQVAIPSGKFSNAGLLLTTPVLISVDNSAEQHYIQRFINFFPKNCLAGKRIGLYEHSSVARDCLKIILTQLGAEVTSLERSDNFVAVDTEAIRAEDIALAQQWIQQTPFDCLVSTDGDGDRPLVGDEKGEWLRGDIVGLLVAHYFKADAVVTPVSSNSALEKSHYFAQTLRTRIGSPFVIVAMQQLAKTADIVIGYEANGGVLQNSPIHLDGRTLAPLPTRDATIVPIALLMLTIERKTTLSELLTALPQRFTVSNRLKNFPHILSQNILAKMRDKDPLAYIKEKFSDIAGNPIRVDHTDGVRITFESGHIIHFRASGNAPELRCYNEADTELSAQQLNAKCMQIMRQWQISVD